MGRCGVCQKVFPSLLEAKCPRCVELQKDNQMAVVLELILVRLNDCSTESWA